MREKLREKLENATVLADAPGGLEYDMDFATDEALLDWTEKELRGDNLDDLVIVEDDGDEDYEDIPVRDSGEPRIPMSTFIQEQ